jgi:hypothetical protein
MMSQRDSGYARLPDDVYETPSWVTMALKPHMRGVQYIWEPACGNGMMARALKSWPTVRVRATDKNKGIDFLTVAQCHHDAVITNPPYSHAEEFIEHALKLMKPQGGRVAMLLRIDYDSAKSRLRLFGDCDQFAKKLVLTSRIRWLAGSTGSPSFNHAWFIWSWSNRAPPTIAYHVREQEEEAA